MIYSSKYRGNFLPIQQKQCFTQFQSSTRALNWFNQKLLTITHLLPDSGAPYTTIAIPLLFSAAFPSGDKSMFRYRAMAAVTGVISSSPTPLSLACFGGTSGLLASPATEGTSPLSIALPSSWMWSGLVWFRTPSTLVPSVGGALGGSLLERSTPETSGGPETPSARLSTSELRFEAYEYWPMQRW